MLGVPVLRPRVLETTALGAAYLAGLAVGVWQDLDQLVDACSIDRRHEPAMLPADVAHLRARWTEAVSRTRGWSAP